MLLSVCGATWIRGLAQWLAVDHGWPLDARERAAERQDGAMVPTRWAGEPGIKSYERGPTISGEWLTMINE